MPPVNAVPVNLEVSAIGLSPRAVKPVGVEKVKQADGSTTLRWQANDWDVGYQPANQGEICSWGLVTLNGHNWWRNSPGVFVNLNKIQPGNKIRVTSDKGVACEYTVEWAKEYEPTDTSWLYETAAIGSADKTYLNLYTCSPPSTNFKNRFVVRASMPRPTSVGNSEIRYFARLN